ncbi:hypothetical protein EA713_08540 [Acinetobacter baumannii]|uniref:AAA family ATPase n=1 Tax=Acinetobacter baumannii TaxID=470 RepID=UPI000F73F4B2|nr:AAA family ATPase [Acinetobacter baumannii]RSQ17224.1 hypothetical protein EA713_08540 [Acinetobacter baumannii]
MIIRSLKVEEGFFNDLEIKFSSGLNVLVGGRGVGKTTAIELLRFGLGAISLTGNQLNNDSIAMSILKSTGRVNIEVELEEGRSIIVSRSAQDQYPIQNGIIKSPIIFSQTEIETIGLNKTGRLSLIDSFIDNLNEKKSNIKLKNNKICSLYSEYFETKKNVNDLYEKTLPLNGLKLKESELIEKYEVIKIDKVNLDNVQNKLSGLQSEISKISVSIENNKEMRKKYLNKIQKITEITDLNQDSLNFLERINHDERGFELFISNLLEEQETLNKILRFNTEAINFIDSKNIGLDERKRNLEIESRDNRLILENSIQGSSVILSELGLVRENIAKIENLNEFLILNKNKMAEIYNEIQSLIVDINNIKNEIYENRVHVVNLLNESLNPYVKISLNNNIDIDDYLSILELSLKGSGMKYKELLPLVAERIPPAWLFYYVENKKYEDFAKVVGIQIDRAARLLSYLDDNNISDILVSQKEDVADFYLLDHGNYKPISELSIGQRCTVILSIIMENKNRILIVDQPEDHLDNEFIVKTLVNSIKRRSIYSQTILSSHNANIPVLGEAKNIINLDSNGRNGFIKLHGPVEEEPIKRVIESLMEGGKEAFEYRSKFYKE